MFFNGLVEAGRGLTCLLAAVLFSLSGFQL
jgi:hypothetical protein